MVVVGDFQLVDTWFTVAGAQGEFGVVWNDAEHLGLDDGGVTFFDDDFLGVELKLGAGWVGDTRPWGEDACDAGGEERAVECAEGHD